MSYSSSPAVLTLLGLRLKGFASAANVAALVGLPERAVQEQLVAAQGLNQVAFRGGSRSRWALLPAGRAETERLLSVELDDTGARAAVDSAYRSFLGLNVEMLALCTRWQVKDLETQTLNDHSDSSYDQEVLDGLAQLHLKIQPVCVELHTALERFEIYSKRFELALTKVQEGEHDWFASPLKESYHTVWFELHEDLLASLGLERASEKLN